MAEWSQPKKWGTLKAYLGKSRKIAQDEVAGQPCPRCGDLWPWSLARCKSCGAKLA